MLQDESGRRDADGGSSFPQKHSVLEHIKRNLLIFIYDKKNYRTHVPQFINFLNSWQYSKLLNFLQEQLLLNKKYNCFFL
jgi:hypothetical protein